MINSSKVNRAIYFLICASILTLMSCAGRTRTVTMDAMRPAEITFPSKVQNLLVVDRTEFDKKLWSVIEGALTGELPHEDLAGVQSLTAAFQNQINYSPRFKTIIYNNRLKGNSMTNAFPPHLSWSRINQICNRNNAQAIVAIEIFDTDFIITNGKRKTKKQIKEDGVTKTIEVDEYYAEGVGNVTIGIRLYDNISRTIVDQQLFSDTHTWNSAAASKAQALAQLISKSDATRHLSSLVGRNYANRIAPMPIRITRSFRARSKKAPALERGSRHADVAEWREAIEVWERGISAAPTKEKGFLAHNIAIAYEVLGEMDAAMDWAQKAYVNYGNKDSRSYVNVLKRRIEDERLAEHQLKK